MTAIEFKFNAALGATYAIEFSTDNQNWSVIEDEIVAEGAAVERLWTGAEGGERGVKIAVGGVLANRDSMHR